MEEPLNQGRPPERGSRDCQPWVVRDEEDEEENDDDRDKEEDTEEEEEEDAHCLSQAAGGTPKHPGPVGDGDPLYTGQRGP